MNVKAEFFGTDNLETLLGKIVDTSIELIVLIVELEKSFGIRFHLSEVKPENFCTKEKLIGFLQEKVKSA